MADQNVSPTPPDAPQETDRGPWLLVGAVILVVIVVLAFLWFSGVFSSGPGEEVPPDSTPVETYVEILQPEENEVLDIQQAITISGMGGALFEGNVVVELRQDDGTVLAQGATIVQSPEAGTGGEGPWQIQLSVAVEPGTPGLVVAYSTSPADGSIVAEDTVAVTFGTPPEAPEPTETPPVEAFIEIEQPAAGAELDVSQPVLVSGQAGGLFEGSLLVQALSADGQVLAESTATIEAPDAGTGGAGPWSVALTIPLEASTAGQITAASIPPEGEAVSAEPVEVSYLAAEATPPVEEAVVLEDYLWLLVNLNDQPLLEGSRIWAEFQEGQVGGLAGCNNYNASYERTQDAISFSEPAVTRKACPEPEGLMDQENLYLQTLTSAAAFRIDAGQLILSNAEGQDILVYDAAVVGNIVAEQGELPPDAVIFVQLQDVSLADVPAEVIAEAQPANPGVFPVPFEITYDPEVIEENRSYAVQVRIEGPDGTLLFTNTQAYSVITRDNPSYLEALLVGVVE